MILKINFSDFWKGFVKENNYFYNLLSKTYEVEISNSPDILFFSCYGNEYLNYKCIRIFYSPENVRPDFTGCDFALTFDFLNDPRHYRLPLYALNIEQNRNLEELMNSHTKEEVISNWRKKTRFCSMVVSNSLATKRIGFYKKLSKYRTVDSGGRYMNNIGGPVSNKLAFIKDYKFVISFENSKFPGYTTEKILDPLLVGSIPIYWGNPLIEKDFNPGRFINYDDFKSEDKLIQKLIEVELNEDEAIKILMQPIFPENREPVYIIEQNVNSFIMNIIDGIGVIKPVAQSRSQIIHLINIKGQIIRHYIKKKTKSGFGW